MSTHRTDYDLLKHVGSQIAGSRHRAGITQAQLAERIEVEPVTLSRWETGSRSPSLTALAKLAAALGVSVGDLADRPDEDPSENSDLSAVRKLRPDQQTLLGNIARELLK